MIIAGHLGVLALGGEAVGARLVAGLAVEDMTADLGAPGEDVPPVRFDVIGVIPKGAIGRVLGHAGVDGIGELLAQPPGAMVLGLVAAPVAPPRKLTAVPPPFAALLDDLADLAREARVVDPVHHHVADGDLARIGLAPGFEVDGERQTFDLLRHLDRGFGHLDPGPRRQGQEEADGQGDQPAAGDDEAPP